MILGKENQTLKGHLLDTADVLKLYIQYNESQLRKNSEKFSYDYEEFKQLLLVGAYFHDLGKSFHRWQDALREGKKLPGHSFISFALIDRILFGEPPNSKYADSQWSCMRRSLVLAVLGHHGMLHDNAFTSNNTMSLGKVEMDIGFVNNFIDECMEREDLKLVGIQKLSNPVIDIPLTVKNNYERYYKKVTHMRRKRRKDGLVDKVLYTQFLSILCLCDNLSSMLAESLIPEGQIWENVMTSENIDDVRNLLIDKYIFDPKKILKEGCGIVDVPNQFQKNILKAKTDNVILNAGCGEGKTAAALLFAKKLIDEGKASKVIFTLPTQFTSNNMYIDFKNNYNINPKYLGIYHGEVESFLKKQYDEEEEVQAHKYQDTFYNKPVTISTVDHLLYSMVHSYKYADRAFANILNSVVIFDEIHYYEKETIKLIGEALRFLRFFKIPHVIMTATMPASMRDALLRIAEQDGYSDSYDWIRGESKIPGSSQIKKPFYIEKMEAPIFNEENKINKEFVELCRNYKDVRQMIVVNQVEKAKKIYSVLKGESNVICYHSEFTRVHRDEKEEIIRILFKPSSTRSKNEKEILEKRGFRNTDNCILICTQICELSLDISADVMMTEVAPVDSIGQRGGRLHRNGYNPEHTKCQCRICKLRKYKENFKFKLFVFPVCNERKSDGLPYVGSKDLEDNRNILQKSYDIL
ncbi:MAG: CRISPR-associated helicase Cas3', partial [Clostridiales bacterium]|nr:CRISPR-associated helicase Cas3' [Clostridiales bacterium]